MNLNHVMQVVLIVFFSLCMFGFAAFEFFAHGNTAAAFALLAIGVGVAYAYFQD